LCAAVRGPPFNSHNLGSPLSHRCQAAAGQGDERARRYLLQRLRLQDVQSLVTACAFAELQVSSLDFNLLGR
jgi:hypothetical protein